MSATQEGRFLVGTSGTVGAPINEPLVQYLRNDGEYNTLTIENRYALPLVVGTLDSGLLGAPGPAGQPSAATVPYPQEIGPVTFNVPAHSRVTLPWPQDRDAVILSRVGVHSPGWNLNGAGTQPDALYNKASVRWRFSYYGGAATEELYPRYACIQVSNKVTATQGAANLPVDFINYSPIAPVFGGFTFNQIMTGPGSTPRFGGAPPSVDWRIMRIRIVGQGGTADLGTLELQLFTRLDAQQALNGSSLRPFAIGATSPASIEIECPGTVGVAYACYGGAGLTVIPFVTYYCACPLD